MSETAANPLVGALLNAFMPSTPPVNVNVQQPQPQQLAPYGEMTQEFEEDERYFSGLDPMGDPETIKLNGVSSVSLGDWDDDDDDDEEFVYYGDPNLPAAVNTAIQNIGGLFNRRRRQERRSSRKAKRDIKQNLDTVVNDIQRDLDELEGAVNRIAATDKKQARAINRLNSRTKATEKRTVQSRYTDAVLQAGRALPGIKSYSLLTSGQFMGVLDAVKELGSADISTLEEATLVAPAATSDAATVQANFQVQTAVLEEKLNNAIGAINAIVAAQTAAGAADAVADYKTVGAENALIAIGKLLPSQLVDREAAIVQAAIQWIFGNVPKVGAGSTFSLSF